jgi:Hydrolases of the alpha/beta superfamily
VIRIIAVCILLLVVMITGGSFFMLGYSLRPDAKMTRKNATAYEYMYATYPFLESWVDSLQNAGALRDTVIADPQGVRLHAFYAAAPEPTDRTAVIVHGYTDCAVRMLMIGYLYNRDLRYNILLPDLHYHGQSGGKAIRMGWKDRLDVLRWMDVANAVFGGETRMVVHGISMGAATTMMLSGERQQPYVKCFVEDCGYTSVWDEFSNELKSSFGLPAFPLMYTASWLCDLKYGWNFHEASALKQVAKCELPMLFIHGAADDFVPTWMVHPLYQAKPGEKDLWLVPGVGHAYSYRDHKEEYTARVREFVGRYIH